MSRGIYVASKTCHYEMWRAMRKAGLPIISTWIDEAGPNETKDVEEFWVRVIGEVGRCSVLILYAEPGEVLKGALIEVGVAFARTIPVIAVVPDSAGSWLSCPLVERCDTIERAQMLALGVLQSAERHRD